jgi:hypothetical protein
MIVLISFFFRKFGRIFAGGNIPKGFHQFRIFHDCKNNKYCQYFGMSLSDDIQVADSLAREV